MRFSLRSLDSVRRLVAGVALLGVMACTNAQTVTEETPLAELGDFTLGYNVVVAKDVQKGPFSRDASEAEIEAALTSAVQSRLGRYDGDKLYHLGVKVDAYVLAGPGVPVLFTPKSVLVLSVNLWDDSQNLKLTEEPKLLTVFESFDGKTIVGSGLTRKKEEQLAILSRNAALKIERWLLENGQWFGVDPIAPSASDAEEARAALEVLAPDAIQDTSNSN